MRWLKSQESGFLCKVPISHIRLFSEMLCNTVHYITFNLIQMLCYKVVVLLKKKNFYQDLGVLKSSEFNKSFLPCEDMNTSCACVCVCTCVNAASVRPLDQTHISTTLETHTRSHTHLTCDTRPAERAHHSRGVLIACNLCGVCVCCVCLAVSR